MKSLIIYSQRYSIHDGNGIRTVVFFKGCPLSCAWCHNPESQSFAPELVFNREKCKLCGACISACPVERLSLSASSASIFELPPPCTGCGCCADACLYEARELVGKEVTVEALLTELDKDAMFYQQSNGGITLSGGEVMAADMDFVEELLRACRQRGYSVNIDTCGYAPFVYFQRIMEFVDVFLYDVKIMDPAKHKKYTGCDNKLILDNLVKLSSEARIHLRLPLVEGINSSDYDISLVLDFIRPLKIEQVSLLPYHQLGQHKAERLGLSYPNMAPPDAERLEEIRQQFHNSGYLTKIGG